MPKTIHINTIVFGVVAMCWLIVSVPIVAALTIFKSHRAGKNAHD